MLRLPVEHLSAEDRAALARLTHMDGIAWPTVTLWAVLTATFLGVYVTAALGGLPLWGGG